MARYADAGHYVGSFRPYTPTTDAVLTSGGGSVAGTLAANVDLHARTLALLATQ